MSDPNDPHARAVHRRELGRLVQFSAVVAAIFGASYLVPQARAVQPWLPGEPLPLVHLVLAKDRVTEATDGTLTLRVVEEEPAPPAPTEVTATISTVAPPPSRAPARFTALDVPDGALDAWFSALARA